MMRVLAIILTVLTVPAFAQGTQPLTSAEPIEGNIEDVQWAHEFRAAIASCYNPGLRRDDDTTLYFTAAFEMTPDALPVADSIEIRTGGDQPGADIALMAFRRAILRCAEFGYDLPQDLFSQWQFVEIQFAHPVPLNKM